MNVTPCAAEDLEDWIALRRALWPGCAEAAHRSETAAALGDPSRMRAWIFRDASGAAAGFAEAALRYDPVNGCETSPVAFLEGIYVAPAARRQGAARLLVAAVESWARGLGCVELASDADIANTGSQQMHAALGFAETERVVYFRKELGE